MQVRLGLFLDLLDSIGWSQEDERESFELRINLEHEHELRAWLIAKREERTTMIGEDAISLRRQEAGDEGHYFIGSSQAESIAEKAMR